MTLKTVHLTRPFMMLGLALGLSACASPNTDVYSNPEAATRAAPISAPLVNETPAFTGSYAVTGVKVHVPEALTVSEANRYIPRGDIVWREDPMGNRHEQVRKIVQAGLEMGAARLQGERAVVVEATVSRFHALTEKARYSVGGVHDIDFELRIIDAETGQMIGAPRILSTDLKAYGGKDALAAEARGETQKIRIVNHLAMAIEQELAGGGYVQQNTGFLGNVASNES